MDKLAEYTRRLLEISARLKKYGEMGSIAQYDMTATAPAGAAARRGKLMAFIRAESRKILLSPQTLETVEFLSSRRIFPVWMTVLKENCGSTAAVSTRSPACLKNCSPNWQH